MYKTLQSTDWHGAAPFNARDHVYARALFQRNNLPNATLLTHDERKVRFYDDIVRDRKVAIGVTYSSCENYCPPVAQHLRAAREMLGELGQSMHFVMLSLTPLDDRPDRLRAYMRQHGLESGWTLLTGRPSEVERVAIALGLLARDPGQRDLRAHATKVRVGDESMVRWGHAAALNPPASVARMIRFALA